MRFDYVKYDEKATADQQFFKSKFQEVEAGILKRLSPGRASSLVLTKLEEAYMWVGKAIRDEQIERGGSAEDVPERTSE